MKAFSIFKKCIALVGIGFGLYLLGLIIGSMIPVNINEAPNNSNETTIYLESNGLHTDLIIPCTYSPNLTPINIDQNNDLTALTWLAFGWGDKGFYV